MGARKLLLIVLLTTACGDGENGERIPVPPLNWGPASTPIFPAGNDLAGAWFICKKTCTELDDSGFLFTEEGQWRSIDAPGSSFEPGESYCEVMANYEGGTYSWDGRRLVMRSGTGGSLTVDVEMLGADHLRLRTADQLIEAVRVEARSSGRCIEAMP